jgi:hypothetical protein
MVKIGNKMNYAPLAIDVDEHGRIYDWRSLNLQSLDIGLCEGFSELSRGIQKFQKFTGVPKEAARFSHVMNIAGEHYTIVQESTTMNWNGEKGVQENPMDLWLENYNGRVWIRKLDFERTDLFYATDRIFWEKHKDDPYESGIPGGLELLLAGLRWHLYVRKLFPNYTPENTPEIHCTELGAKRITFHELWKFVILPHRMPPWVWWAQIDTWLRCPISRPIRIK